MTEADGDNPRDRFDVETDSATDTLAPPDRRLRANEARFANAASPGAATIMALARRTTPRINLSVRLGPMVRFEVQGESCDEIADALSGFDRLNRVVDEMFSDLAARIYPDGEMPDADELQ